MLIWVVIVAVLLALAGWIGRRSSRAAAFRGRAALHRSELSRLTPDYSLIMATTYEKRAAGFVRDGGRGPSAPRAIDAAKSREYQRLAMLAFRHFDLNIRLRDYHEGLAAKYEWAAIWPWLPVRTDPPEPQWGDAKPVIRKILGPGKRPVPRSWANL